ncbi:hypothetical protein K388_07318 [Streptomyces sp. KhCrAH-43]|uniref:hypothetical protein n=1 Tax=unclassified Streptomyces TaxID=2593676 RepID=UPI00037CB14A|nr:MULTISPECIES: hypothetical protein [unclassified Streptomyces]MYS32946.1 hypothetical protein [Streptomyces sp. SID4920]MYX64509.1 hypothetical protein [Streptomyces sp. SID8373]RAJ45704.1 hypothetical protein K388_07318 [Streptomyces sp. KhCrAH-43]
MASTLELPEAALTALRDHLMATAADEDKTPLEELDGLSDNALTAYWRGYVEASKSGSTGQALHIAAFGASLFPPNGVCTEVDAVRDALAQSLK